MQPTPQRASVDLRDFLTNPHSIVALDYGTQKTGVAVGNTLLCSSQALPLIPMKDGLPHQPALDSLLSTWQPQLILVGLPLNMDDSENELCLRAAKFARRIHANTLIPVFMLDERLTSRDARSHLRQSINPHSRSPKHQLGKNPIDSIAASLLLAQFYTSPIGFKP